MASSQAYALPFVRQPFANELMSSWLGRVATLYGGMWPELVACNARKPISIRDHNADPEQAAVLSALTRVDAEIIKRLDLSSRFPKQPLKRFICHPGTGVAVPDFCGLCFHEDLAEGRDNYYRHEWALAGISHCHTHQRLLHSCCDNPRCYGNENLRMCLIKGLVRVVCTRCGMIPGARSEYSRSPRTNEVMRFETDILKALRGTSKCQPPFRVIDDLAFLYFYSALPRAYYGCKTDLQRSTPVRVRLTKPMRKEGGIEDAAVAYPLASLTVYKRLHLMMTVLCVLRGECIPAPDQCRDYALSLWISFADLFWHLGGAGREEMVCRANAWPRIFRKQVEQIITRPRTTNPHSRLIHREPWISSDARRRVNDGVIPVYSNL